MKIGRLGLAFILFLCVLVELSFSTMATTGEKTFSAKAPREKQLAPIGEITEKAIRTNKITGAVILIGNQDKVIYRKAFGYRAIFPKKLPMTVDTIFDLSSLTKVIATTTALMQLVEKGKLNLEDPVADYWPDFKANGKGHITVRELLTHYSGLRPDLNLNKKWSGYNTALKKIIAEKPVSLPGTRFIYSDINFIILGELVHRISGQPLDVYCSDHIFKPLGMKDTVFKPSPALYNRIASTQYKHLSRKIHRGEVHDPTAFRMGGVAGHAGLFSTADDLSVFVQMLLNGGKIKNVKILSPLMVEKMTTPQSPPNKIKLRGLGWDIDSPFASNRGELFPVGSYGHSGFTGTSIWIDPVTRTYVIILTNRIHQNAGQNKVKNLRAEISTIVAASLGPVSSEQVLASRRSLTGYYEIMKSYRIQGVRNGKVQTGIDVLEKEKFTALKGLRVGLITNHSGIDSSGHLTLNILYKAPGVKLTAIFSPEHGLSGNVEEASTVRSSRDPKTGLPVYSLYGSIERPTDKMLKGLDALVFDIQDAGVRFYTYITTMGYAMEAAARNKIAFYILDRPNPITCSMVQGPILDKDLKSFVGYFPLPVRYGMTMGELAVMFNKENKIGANLHVIKMHGYERTDWYDETGLLWVKPSPNLRTLTEAILYPGVAMVEGANVSVGRGTDTPFELLGAPWINAKELAMYLNDRKIQGVRFMPVDFTPASSRFENQICHGIQIILINRQSLNPAVLGIELAAALYKLYPKDFLLDKTLDLIGSRWILQAIKNGQDPSSIMLKWQDQLEQFRRLRSKYLFY
jgi:uncharacterized protein YbbC (DUF1343 family)/CubicO group peptidase (beta-lactamase class C family)